MLAEINRKSTAPPDTIFFYHNFGILTGNQIGAKGKCLNIKTDIQLGVGDQHHNIKSGIQTVTEGQQLY